MKAAICNLCLSSTILCKACKEKLDKGIISKADVEVSRLLHQISIKSKSLKDITVRKVISTPTLIVIICKKGDAAKIVGRSGVIVKQLSKTLDKIVRIVEETSDYRSLLQSLIYPVPVLGINILYTPEKEMLRLRLPRKASMPISVKSLSQIVKELFEKDIELVSE